MRVGEPGEAWWRVGTKIKVWEGKFFSGHGVTYVFEGVVSCSIGSIRSILDLKFK